MQVSNDYRFRLDVLKRLLSEHFREKKLTPSLLNSVNISFNETS